MNIANDVEESIDSNFLVHTPVFVAVFVANCAVFVVATGIGPVNFDNQTAVVGLVDFGIACHDTDFGTKTVDSVRGTKIVVSCDFDYYGTNSAHETAGFVLETKFVDSDLEAKTADSGLVTMTVDSGLVTMTVDFGHVAMIVGFGLVTTIADFALETMTADFVLEAMIFDYADVETSGSTGAGRRIVAEYDPGFGGYD